ncbi:hypothetical protein CDD82_5766 [Ophiocordyceps australis]|uniref:HPP transmembrane region domain-containing protein n=1 Tax=Ophiocordyceps australis TaxID=1399860 RepID=A0A2C5ZRN2_9HYPO|nr:hypothetical protein CDD82_5766 [Ophiocordyceps australis]
MTPRHWAWNFDIDGLLNPFVPRPPWRYLPYPIARFLGYRKTKPQATGNVVPIFWSFIGIFCAIIVIEQATKHVSAFEDKGVPTVIVGSFGAAAVLQFYAIESPLAQPRNAIGGQLLASIIGVGIAKLFRLSHRFDDIQWLGGALACSATTALMGLTKTMHPPAGATALLAVVDKKLLDLGWRLIPVMMLGCALMLGVALLLNNIDRQFPMYWWTPQDLRQGKSILQRVRENTSPKPPDKSVIDEEKVITTRGSSDDTEAGVLQQPSGLTHEAQDALEAAATGNVVTRRDQEYLIMKHGKVIVPNDMLLSQEEEQLLETMSYRL